MTDSHLPRPSRRVARRGGNDDGEGDASSAALDARLRASAPPRLPDDGFTAGVMAAIAMESGAAAPRTRHAASSARGPRSTTWLTPAEAARRAAREQRHGDHMRRWTRRGLFAGGAVAALSFSAQLASSQVAGPSAGAAVLAWSCVSLTLAALLARELSPR